MAEYDESDYDSDSGSYSDYVHEEQAIFRAVRAFDVEAYAACRWRDPDMFETTTDIARCCMTRCYCSARRDMDFLIQERLGCISVLLKAGASVDKLVMEATALHWSAGVESEAYQLVIAALLEAGADPNFTDTRFSTQWQRSVLAKAAASGTAGAVRMLIAAGAVDVDRALYFAIRNGKQRNSVPLLRAGAALPLPAAQSDMWPVPGRSGSSQTRAYIENIMAAGGYKAYEKAHRERLLAIFLPKLPHLPADMLGRVLEFVFDVGGH